MEVEISMLVEISVYSHSHIVAYAHHGTKSIGTQTHVGILAHILKGLAFLLHGVVGTAFAIYKQALAMYLRSLSLCGAFNKYALYANAGTCGHLLQDFSIYDTGVHHNLYVLNGGTVIDGNEVNGLAGTVSAYPAFYTYFFIIICAFKSISYFRTNHLFT